MRRGLDLDTYMDMLHNGEDPHQKLRELAKEDSGERGPWAGVCCKSCWFAAEEKCICRCLGKNHGKGVNHGRGVENEKEVSP